MIDENHGDEALILDYNHQNGQVHFILYTPLAYKILNSSSTFARNNNRLLLGLNASLDNTLLISSVNLETQAIFLAQFIFGNLKSQLLLNINDFKDSGLVEEKY